MNETSVNKVRKLGDGQYHLTAKEAGEAYRAARAYKVKGDVLTWRRPKNRKAAR
jgi:hypothetical protein